MYIYSIGGLASPAQRESKSGMHFEYCRILKFHSLVKTPSRKKLRRPCESLVSSYESFYTCLSVRLSFWQIITVILLFANMKIKVRNLAKMQVLRELVLQMDWIGKTTRSQYKVNWEHLYIQHKWQKSVARTLLYRVRKFSFSVFSLLFFKIDVMGDTNGSVTAIYNFLTCFCRELNNQRTIVG